MVVQAPHAPLSAPAGFVVAGGHSRRMGRDKALLPWDGGTLLEHAVTRLRTQCASVSVLCGATLRYVETGLPLVLDALPDGGPLAALAAGLARLGPGQVGVFLAVDLPAVPSALLVRLLAHAAGHAAVVPRGPRGFEPLCALYRSTCLPAVQRRLEQGERRMTCFWSDVDVLTLEATAFADLGSPADMFRNLNAPADYDAAERAFNAG